VPCPECGHARLRPHIVWFGEMPFHMGEIERALAQCTHFVAIGTSGQVYPAAGMLQQARARGAMTWVQALEAPVNLDAARPLSSRARGHSSCPLLLARADCVGMALRWP
jgi:NAD-dependent SIR2 family protein deacetylase